MHQILSSRQAAQYLGVSIRTLWRRVRCGLIPCIRDGSTRFLRSDLDHYIERRRSGSVPVGAKDRALVRDLLSITMTNQGAVR